MNGHPVDFRHAIRIISKLKVASALGLEVLDSRVFWAILLLGIWFGVTILNWLLSLMFHIVF